ncbi:MAG TPA: phosphatidylserine/phosphatidylglycerophosphate/cardiolipin synthase family protein [Patescibacteria group bacterium]
MQITERIPASLPSELPLIFGKKELLKSGKEIFSRMVESIKSAKYSVDMQYYSFEADGPGKAILEAIEEAKTRNPNLKVRILVDNSIEHLHNGERVKKNEDARARRDRTNEMLIALRDKGVLDDVKITNSFDLKNKITNSLKLFSNIWHRDHKKLFLVDARPDIPSDAISKAIVGSANVNSHHESEWKDAGIYLEGGQVVKALAEDFEDTEGHAKRWERVYSVKNPSEYWKKYRKDILKGLPFSLGQLAIDGFGSIVRNADRRGYRRVISKDPTSGKERDIVVATDSFWPRIFGLGILGAHDATEETFRLLRKAKPKESVTVVTPYPGFFTLTRRITSASKRGVDVSLIIPSENNHALYNHKKIDEFGFAKIIPGFLQDFIRRIAHKNLSHWEERLLKGGVTLYKYKGEKDGLHGMIHFKGAQLIRNEGSVRDIVGSSNYTKGPISGLNREIVVGLESTVDKDPMVGFIQELKDDSEVVVSKKSYRRRSQL